MADADSFLQENIAQEQLSAPYDIVVAWDSQQGIHFKGSIGLEGDFSLNANFGPIYLEKLSMAVKPQDERFDIEASTSGRLSLGPLTASVEEIGVSVEILFNGGNLGLYGLSPDFKPPKGLAIEIEASVVSGGGYLYFDQEKAQYSGIIQLQFEQLSLTAIGLLTTRMPDGTSGYSLLIILTVEDFQPIQLGLGFKLTGIGGLFGFNRTVAIDTLRAGLKNQTLDRILFPKDPLKNSSAIISTLRTVFPPTSNQYVLGPIAQLAWGKAGISNRQFRDYHRIPLPCPTGITRANESALPPRPKLP